MLGIALFLYGGYHFIGLIKFMFSSHAEAITKVNIFKVKYSIEIWWLIILNISGMIVGFLVMLYARHCFRTKVYGPPDNNENVEEPAGKE